MSRRQASSQLANSTYLYRAPLGNGGVVPVPIAARGLPPPEQANTTCKLVLNKQDPETQFALRVLRRMLRTRSRVEKPELDLTLTYSRRSMLLQWLPQSVLRVACDNMLAKICPRPTMLAVAGLQLLGLYIVLQGSVMLLNPIDGAEMAVLGPGSIIGEALLLEFRGNASALEGTPTNIPEGLSLRASAGTHLLMLTKSAWDGPVKQATGMTSTSAVGALVDQLLLVEGMSAVPKSVLHSLVGTMLPAAMPKHVTIFDGETPEPSKAAFWLSSGEVSVWKQDQGEWMPVASVRSPALLGLRAAMTCTPVKVRMTSTSFVQGQWVGGAALRSAVNSIALKGLVRKDEMREARWLASTLPHAGVSHISLVAKARAAAAELRRAELHTPHRVLAKPTACRPNEELFKVAEYQSLPLPGHSVHPHSPGPARGPSAARHVAVVSTRKPASAKDAEQLRLRMKSAEPQPSSAPSSPEVGPHSAASPRAQPAKGSTAQSPTSPQVSLQPYELSPATAPTAANAMAWASSMAVESGAQARQPAQRHRHGIQLLSSGSQAFLLDEEPPAATALARPPLSPGLSHRPIFSRMAQALLSSRPHKFRPNTLAPRARWAPLQFVRDEDAL